MIKYRGFNKSLIWKTDQKLEEYIKKGYERPIKSDYFYMPVEFHNYIDNHPHKSFFKQMVADLKSKDRAIKIGLSPIEVISIRLGEL